MQKRGNREIARITGLTQVTVGRIIDDITTYPEEFNAYMKERAGSGQEELYGMWSFILENRRRWTQERQETVKRAMVGALKERGSDDTLGRCSRRERRD
jgi:hypothetical protein